MIFAGTKDGKTYGFYLENEGLKSSVELTDDEHMALMDGQAEGKEIVFHEGAKPTLQDPPPRPMMTLPKKRGKSGMRVSMRFNGGLSDTSSKRRSELRPMTRTTGTRRR